MSRHLVLPGLALAIALGCASPAHAQLRGEVYVSGLSAPVAFVQDPSDATVQYVVELGGLIRVIKNGALQATPFIDLSATISVGGERGLLGLALPPNYATTGRFFVNFTNPAGHTVVARFKRSAGNPLVADPSTRFDFLWSSGQRWIPQPFSNHNGGNLAFGPDGYLYIGMGDGGSANDPFHLAQSRNNLLGKMLRIDVNVADTDMQGFDVPATNPFVAGPPGTLPEIWDFGMRNPWRFSFDDPSKGGTGALIIGDVGQAKWEEIDYEPAGRGGRNYGWRNYEGSRENVGTESLALMPVTFPAFEYDHFEGAAITGGWVYRGAALAAGFRGRYFFADLNGRVWSLRLDMHASGEATGSDLREHSVELSVPGGLASITSFGVDAAGEIYICSLETGRIIRIASATGTFPAARPLAAADVNRDFQTDLVWHHESQGYVASWLMNGLTETDSILLHPERETDTNWKIVATPRLNPDAKTDLVWQHQTQGWVAAWIMNGPTLIESVLLNPKLVTDLNWKIVASGDINGDGKTDLIWQHRTQGYVAAWLMDGVTMLDSVLLGPGRLSDTDWTVVGTGDFNADGRTDLVWWHRTQGWIAVWHMNGTALMSSVGLTPERVGDVNWAVAGVGDFNQDGKPDLLWQNRTEGWLATWLMNGTTLIDSLLLTPSKVTDPGWKVVGPK